MRPPSIRTAVPANRSSAGPALTPSPGFARLTALVTGPLLARDSVPPLAAAPTRGPADEAELGALALFLLDGLAGALTLVPARRREDTRRLFALFAGYGPAGPQWARLAALPDDQFDDVVARARIAFALTDHPPAP